MILCQNPVPVPSAPFFHNHRRLPSAPSAVVIHSTATPGLFSLSKPPRPPQPRQSHQQQQQQQHQHQHQRQFRSSKPKPVHRNITTTPSSESKPPTCSPNKKPTQPPAHSATPDKIRGRHHVKSPNAKSNRSASQSSLSEHRRRSHHTRQPSPPIPPPSPAEFIGDTTSFHSHSGSLSSPVSTDFSLFDPFISSSDTDSSTDLETVPEPQFNLHASPSKSARGHRQMPSFPHTPPSKSLPVPVAGTEPREFMSRSEPPPSWMIAQTRRRKNRNKFESDSTVSADVFKVTPPSTPDRPHNVNDVSRQLNFLFGSPFQSPPFAAAVDPALAGRLSPSPSPLHRHHRVPSDGVFNMSFDDEQTPSKSSDEINALYFTFPKRRNPLRCRAGRDESGYFASSTFQNSPGPDELPPPSFGASP